MPESPEITARANEMNSTLVGKKITGLEVLQPKCLNLPVQEMQDLIQNATIKEVSHHGKWIKVKTDRGWLLINLGMGGELLLTSRNSLPPKLRIILDFQDETCLVINFWWFGYLHYESLENLYANKMLAKLGPDVLEISLDQFRGLLIESRKKVRIKPFLLDQSNLAGIGNAYIHDILFLAGLHPDRLVNSLRSEEIDLLYRCIQDSLRLSLSKGGAFYELTLFGDKGGFSMEDVLIGYKEGATCPHCGTIIQKIRTGSNQSFICPTCQPLD